MDVNSVGAAVDIGTSHVTVRLIDLKSGVQMREWRFPNPQQAIALEVISRIRHSLRNPTFANQITAMIRDAISSEIKTAFDTMGLDSSRLESVVIVGNTVMHHIFFDLPVKSLVRPPYKAECKAAICTTSDTNGLLSLPGVEVYSPPIVESFIGPDALMLLLVSGMLEDTTSAVAVDVGTNTEIIVSHDDELWIASAASGPAFEGMSLECGMPAEDGAITKVQIDSAGRPSFGTIGDRRPRGICGSGAISAMAGLLDSGLMNRRGSFISDRRSPYSAEFQVGNKYVIAQAAETDTGKSVYLSQIDIRQVQLSKAAICAATTLLLERSRCTPEGVKRFFLTGAFGYELCVDDAFRIGLFPNMPHAAIEQMNGGAVEGATRLLLRHELRDDLEEASQRLRYIELTDDSDFHRLHLECQFYPDA